jgi:hypothetical protein
MMSESYLYSKQTFGITTYGALFKSVLSKDTIRSSFFEAFIPDLKIISSEILDDHMNPAQELQNLRSIINSKESSDAIKSLRQW